MIKPKSAAGRLAARFIAVGLLIFVCCLALVSARAGKQKIRRLYFFPNKDDGKLCAETRLLDKTGDTNLALRRFVQEITLGSFERESAPLFNKETTVRSCFIRNGCAYIDLSAECLPPLSGVTETKYAAAILEKNVFTNFKNVDKIYLYINGNGVYDRDGFVSRRETARFISNNRSVSIKN